MFELPSTPSELLKLANRPVFDIKGNKLGLLRRIIMSKEENKPLYVEVGGPEEVTRYPANWLFMFRNRLLLIEGGVSEYLKCPKCGSFTPKAEICIYCGQELIPQKPRVEALKTKELLSSSVRDLVKEYAEAHIRSMKLISLALDGKISDATFNKLYDEYDGKLKELSASIQRELKKQKDVLKEVKESLSRLEEAKSVLSASEYTRRKASLDKRLLSAELNISALTVPLLAKETEAADLLDQAKRCLDSLNALKLRGARKRKVKSFLEESIKSLDEVLRWKETLKAKLEIGELSHEAYEHLSKLSDALSG